MSSTKYYPRRLPDLWELFGTQGVASDLCMDPRRTRCAYVLLKARTGPKKNVRIRIASPRILPWAQTVSVSRVPPLDPAVALGSTAKFVEANAIGAGSEDRRAIDFISAHRLTW